MRIAFIAYAFYDFSIGWTNALAEEGNDILLIMPHEAKDVPGKSHKRVTRVFLNPARLRQPHKQFGNMLTIRRELSRFKPDVLHIQQGYLWLNLVLPFIGQYPLVITVHDPIPHKGDTESRKTPQAVYEFGWRRARQLIVHGNQLRKIVVDELGYPADRVHMIPLIRPQDDALPAATTIPEQEKIILFFGRIWEYKGLDYLIRAEPLITAQVPDARIMIAGRGEDFDKYRAMMVNPQNFIIDNDFIPDDKIPEYFLRSSVVALPYLEATQSGVIPHACAYERPVVATAVGSLPDLVEDGKTGYLVPPRDEKALAEAIVRLLQNPEQARAMGKAGKIKFETDAAPHTVARKTLDVYQLALR
ncbi:MAG: glycosyltransferase family 4 protein [Chloroflexota bacterium]|nr:glycosyltransferase family 4 protein [Chloroflexota bacterium]